MASGKSGGGPKYRVLVGFNVASDAARAEKDPAKRAAMEKRYEIGDEISGDEIPGASLAGLIEAKVIEPA